MRKNNKARDGQRDRKITAAIAEHLTGSAILTLDGQPYKAKELQQMLQDRMDAVTAADALKAKWQVAIADADEKTKQVAGILPALRRHLLSTYGAKSQILADFGFTVKPAKVTVEAKAEGVQKSRATRKARGTKGSKQKAKIKGVVTPEVIAPAAAPANDGASPKNAGAA
jgi:hypothetical protein